MLSTALLRNRQMGCCSSGRNRWKRPKSRPLYVELLEDRLAPGTILGAWMAEPGRPVVGAQPKAFPSTLPAAERAPNQTGCVNHSVAHASYRPSGAIAGSICVVSLTDILGGDMQHHRAQ
jgi:hypothetical protein